MNGNPSASTSSARRTPIDERNGTRRPARNRRAKRPRNAARAAFRKAFTMTRRVELSSAMSVRSALPIPADGERDLRKEHAVVIGDNASPPDRASHGLPALPAAS